MKYENSPPEIDKLAGCFWRVSYRTINEFTGSVIAFSHFSGSPEEIVRKLADAHRNAMLLAERRLVGKARNAGAKELGLDSQREAELQ